MASSSTSSSPSTSGDSLTAVVNGVSEKTSNVAVDSRYVLMC